MIDAGTTVALLLREVHTNAVSLKGGEGRPGQLLGSSVQQQLYVSPAIGLSGVADAHVACGSSEPIISLAL